MAQHFLLSAKARSLSVTAIARLSDDEAHAMFCKLRWPETGGEPVCPRCGSLIAYAMKTRARMWKCKECRHQFSVTSGTIFSSRKLAIRDHLLAAALFVNGVKGLPALQLSRDINCQYKSAFVMLHKLREAIGAGQSDGELSGTVEIDGCYVGGAVRQENEAAGRTDRRGDAPGRQSVVIARERGKNGRTLPVVVKKESDAVGFIRQHVASGTTVHADEAPGWDRLHAHYAMMRINHSVAFSKDGACTNQAESFFSRLRRAEFGQHHHISGKYLICYAREMAWKEDNRRVANGDQHQKATAAALAHPVSRTWCGYWQRRLCILPTECR